MKLCNDKYEFNIVNGILYCLKYGKPWRDFHGNDAVLALFRYAEELEERAGEKDASHQAQTL